MERTGVADVNGSVLIHRAGDGDSGDRRLRHISHGVPEVVHLPFFSVRLALHHGVIAVGAV